MLDAWIQKRGLSVYKRIMQKMNWIVWSRIVNKNDEQRERNWYKGPYYGVRGHRTTNPWCALVDPESIWCHCHLLKKAYKFDNWDTPRGRDPQAHKKSEKCTTRNRPTGTRYDNGIFFFWKVGSEDNGIIDERTFSSSNHDRHHRQFHNIQY